MRVFYIILFCFCFSFCNAQEERELHSRNKKALALFKQAQEFDHVGNLYQSYELLQQVLAKDDSFDEAVLLTHQVLVKRGEIEKAQSLYEEHKEKVDKEFNNRMLSDAAYFYFSIGEYAKAKELKDKIEGKVVDVDDALLEIVTSSIEYSIQEKAHPRNVEFEKLPPPLNTQPQQYFPSITGSDLLVYTVRESKGRGDENLYASQKEGDVWSQPVGISEKINSDRNEGTASISADGNTLVYTACNAPDGIGSCDLYIAYRDGSDWTEPRNLGRQINTIHWESQPSLSQDGRELYFVSSRPNGLGGQDIWKSSKVNGVWKLAENLGPSINTRFDDCSPYIHPNGVNLIFASRGRLGFGGYDLYGTELESGGWTAPENLGYPINNYRNQVGYTISLDGWAYYSDNQFDGTSELFKFKLPEDLVPKRSVSFKRGMVLSRADSTPIFSTVSIADIAKDSIVSRTYSDKESGRFNVVIQEIEGANLYIKKHGYILFKEKVDSLWHENELAKIYLRPVSVGQEVVLNDILFELNSAALSKTATKELEEVAAFLRENPELVVEIGGHTDSSGEEAYNLQLSTERAKSVYDYLLGENISEHNLTYKGYGETKLLTADAVSQFSSKNRRIEITIMNILK